MAERVCDIRSLRTEDRKHNINMSPCSNKTTGRHNSVKISVYSAKASIYKYIYI